VKTPVVSSHPTHWTHGCFLLLFLSVHVTILNACHLFTLSLTYVRPVISCFRFANYYKEFAAQINLRNFLDTYNIVYMQDLRQRTSYSYNSISRKVNRYIFNILNVRKIHRFARSVKFRINMRNFPETYTIILISIQFYRFFHVFWQISQFFDF